MTALDPAALQRRADAIHRNYERHFAGHPRITRDAALLDAMIAESDEALAEAGAPAGDELAEVLSQLRANRDLYVREAAAIREAQQGGSEAFEAHALRTWIDAVAGAYKRHFAGKGRMSRDAALLAELADTVEGLRGRLRAIEGRIGAEQAEGLAGSLSHYQDLFARELEAIAAAYDEAEPPAQVSALAAIANGQFALYQDLFAGRPRVSRRPALLERMTTTLERALAAMRAIAAGGFADPANEGNMGVVEARLTSWKAELVEIRGAREQVTLAQIADALSEVANGLFSQYGEAFAGRDRGTRDPLLLSRICDALHEVALQMQDLDRVLGDGPNRHNLRLVLENLRTYEREHALILEAQQQ